MLYQLVTPGANRKREYWCERLPISLDPCGIEGYINLCDCDKRFEMDVALVMFTEKGERRDFAVSGSKAVIGRHTECDIQIPLGEISRRHCEIVLKKDKIAVRDLGSSNGTYINNRRIQQAEVKAGETLTVGPVIFTVVINGVPAEIKPIKTMIHVKKNKSAKKAVAAKKKDDTGSVDLAGSGELEMADSGESGAPAELEELSKQRKGKP